jgi:hypothetical protein
MPPATGYGSSADFIITRNREAGGKSSAQSKCSDDPEILNKVRYFASAISSAFKRPCPISKVLVLIPARQKSATRVDRENNTCPTRKTPEMGYS